MMRMSLLVLPLLLLAMNVGARGGDALLLEGSGVLLRDLEIREIAGGQVVYADVRGRVVWRDLDEVAALRFAELPDLERADRLRIAEQFEEARSVFRTMVGLSERKEANLWLHLNLARLARLERDDADLAIHIAELIRLQEDPWWRTLAPVQTVEGRDESVMPADPRVAAAALERIDAALSGVRQPALRALLERLRAELAPAAAKAPPVGEVPVRPLRTAPQARPVEMPAEPDPVRVHAPSVPQEVRSHPEESSPRVPEPARAGNAVHAEVYRPLSEILPEAEASGSPRDRARALLRAGQMLVDQKRPRDAVLAFLRCGLAYAQTPEASRALLAAARLYESELGNRGAAMRVAQRVVRSADDADVAREAASMIERLIEAGDR